MARRIGTYIVWALLVVALALAFIMTSSGLLLALTIAAVALPVIGLLVMLPARDKVSCTLSSPTVGQKGNSIECTIHVDNQSRIPLLRVEVTVAVHNLLTQEVSHQDLRLAVQPGGTQDMQFTLLSNVCGRCQVAVEQVRLCDPFGLLSLRANCQATRRLSVMPTLRDAHMRSLYASAPLSDTTVFSQFVKGSDLSEVFGIRTYEPGDELRSVHWKLSTKHDGLVVRVPSLPLDNTLLMFWDKGLYGRPADPLAADAMAEVVLALSEQLIDAGMPFTAITDDRASNRCLVERVEQPDDIYEMIGQLMGSPLHQHGESALQQYLRLYGQLDSARVIYVSMGEPTGFEDDMAGKDALLVLCDGQAGLEAQPGMARVHFGAGQAQLALEQLEVV